MSATSSKVCVFRSPLEDMARAHSFRLSVEIFATENRTTRFRKLNTGVGRPLLCTPSHCFPMKKFSLVSTQS